MTFFFVAFIDWPTAEEMIKQPILKELVEEFHNQEHQDLQIWDLIQMYLEMMYEEKEENEGEESCNT